MRTLICLMAVALALVVMVSSAPGTDRDMPCDMSVVSYEATATPEVVALDSYWCNDNTAGSVMVCDAEITETVCEKKSDATLKATHIHAGTSQANDYDNLRGKAVAQVSRAEMV